MAHGSVLAACNTVLLTVIYRMAQCHNTNNEVAAACKLNSIVDLKQLYIEDGSVS